MTLTRPSGIIIGVKSLPINQVYLMTFPVAFWRRAVLASLNILTECVGCGLKTLRILRVDPGRWENIVWLRGILGGLMEHMPRAILYQARPGSVNTGCEVGWESMNGAAGKR